MPICQGCGGSFSDEFNFCNYCGRAKPETNSLKIQVKVSSEDRWETCKVDNVMVEKSKGALWNARPPKLKWIANAIGPKGQYVAAESVVFDGFLNNIFEDYPFFINPTIVMSKAIKERNAMNSKLYDDFINTLLKDGWDCIETEGICKKFRRRAR
jgi:hypothetical protein